MPAKKRGKSINLLPQEEFKSSVVGRILKWALSTFRIMVIICEIIVMGAFLSRFWLDARNSDLNEEITVATAKIKAYESTEKEFRSLQKKLLVVKELYAQDKTSSLIDTVSQYMPSDVFLNSISLVNNSIQVKSMTLSEQSIIQFITNLESTDVFGKISLSQIASDAENESLITFTLTIEIK